jgi:hypothetical protein
MDAALPEAEIPVTNSPYSLVSPVTGFTAPLFQGRNVVGRCAAAVDVVSFINLDSPRSAISRMHAVLIIAPNNDAWVYDARSTNGTQIAVNSGLGVKMEPERMYQLFPGTRLTFGDVDMLFLNQQNEPSAPNYEPTTGSAHRIRSTGDLPQALRARSRSIPQAPSASKSKAEELPALREADSAKVSPEDPPRARAHVGPAAVLAMIEASAHKQLHHEDPTAQPLGFEPNLSMVELLDLSGVSPNSRRPSGTAQPTAVEGSRPPGDRPGDPCSPRDVPYLMDDSDTEKGKTKAPARQQRTKTTVRAASHRKREREEVHSPEGQSPQTRSAEPKDASQRIQEPLRVCLSGLDSTTKKRAFSLIEEKNGKVVEAAEEMTLLVVGAPATRTPKFLIAMGRGVPIVTIDFLKDPSASLDDAVRFTPPLEHNGVTLPAKRLAPLIQQRRQMRSMDGPTAIFSGRRFYVGDIPAKQRGVVTDIITGCGGSIVKKSGGTAVEIVTDPEELYSEILKGSR